MNWIFGTKPTLVEPIRTDDYQPIESKSGGIIAFIDEKVLKRIERKAGAMVESTQNYKLGIIALLFGMFLALFFISNVICNLFIVPFSCVLSYLPQQAGKNQR